VSDAAFTPAASALDTSRGTRLGSLVSGMAQHGAVVAEAESDPRGMSLETRAARSDTRRWPSDSPRREALQTDNSARAQHMVAVRDQQLTNARRQEMRLEAAACSSFFPLGYVGGTSSSSGGSKLSLRRS
jgi:hypothetical protein